MAIARKLINQSMPRVQYLLFECAVALSLVVVLPPTLLILVRESQLASLDSAIGTIIALPLQLFGMWSVVMSMLVLGYYWGYILICGLIFICCAIILFREPFARRIQFIATIILLVTFVFMISPYQPAVAPANGYQMVNLTPPGLFLRGWKNAASIGEFDLCKYRLLGWQQETLYYQENCGSNVERIWRFTPGLSKSPEQYVKTVPDGMKLDSVPKIDVVSVSEWFQIQKTTGEFSRLSLLGLALRNGVSFSPNQKWLVVIAQQYTYGPEDVLVLSRNAE